VKWLLLAAVLCVSPPVDHQHDFDFEFGSWKAHLCVRQRLSNESTWAELDGTSVVRKIWDGRANAGELEVGNASTHIEGLTLRLYNPKTQQWNIYWSNSKDGAIGGAPMFGQFNNGRGEFYGQDSGANGASIYARFVFSDITATSFKFEQAFSNDGGKSWETNWTATFTR
jgi:hypothetical protein